MKAMTRQQIACYAGVTVKTLSNWCRPYRQELEALLGHTVHHFSYPHGAYNADTLTIVKQQSFRTALCAWGGTVRRGAIPLTLPRIELRQP